jgi:hypothetical protein
LRHRVPEEQRRFGGRNVDRGGQWSFDGEARRGRAGWHRTGARRLVVARAAALLVTAVALVVGCHAENEKKPPAVDLLASLRAFERARREKADFAHAPPGDGALGPDPYAIVPLESGGFVGLLRGRDLLVRLDDSLAEIARVKAPAGASGIAVSGDRIVAVGQRSGIVARFEMKRGLEAIEPIVLEPKPDGLRAVATSGEIIYAVDEENDRLFWAAGESGARGSAEICRAPFRLLRTGPWLVAPCLIDHAIVAIPLDSKGIPHVGHAVRAEHDGPFWGLDAAMAGDELVVIAGGVENHPLDRTGGSFGYIDSFVFELRLKPGDKAFRETRAVNVSELGVVIPKAIAIVSRGEALEALVTGAGSANAVWLSSSDAAPRVVDFVPGASAVAKAVGDRFVFADPLLDAWVRFDGAKVDVVAVKDDAPPREVAAKVGEALVFTTLIAPKNKSDGALSRFTCETCHFEGTIDGRTHATGRGDVIATTKPLLGLFPNRPHFSRALDPDLSAVAENEFKVANANSGFEPHFSIGLKEAPWLAHLGVSGELGPEALREAFMTFFMTFAPRRNARTAGRSAMSDDEKRGATVFSDHCERCHEARLTTDTAASRKPFEGWEQMIFADEEPIVWASDRYEKTGVEPYVHAKGARVPSLRRLARKRPYFTNGAAKTLADVLDRARFEGANFWHDKAPSTATPLERDDQTALLAFLRLL